MNALSACRYCRTRLFAGALSGSLLLAACNLPARSLRLPTASLPEVSIESPATLSQQPSLQPVATPIPSPSLPPPTPAPGVQTELLSYAVYLPFQSHTLLQVTATHPSFLATAPAVKSEWPGLSGVPTPFPELSPAESINILLLGADKRSGPAFRTDTLVIVSILPRHHAVTLISIPRDLYVYVPGWEMARINTAYLHGELEHMPGGGPALLQATLLYNLGIRIDRYAMVDFAGFRQIVNTLDGIDLPLVCPYTDWHIKNPNRPTSNPSNWKLITVGPGLVHMDGELALWYARSRLKSSDFDRGRRQQEVLRALYARALKVSAIRRLPELYAQTSQNVTTDLTLPDLLALVPLAADLGAAQIRSFYIGSKLVEPWRTADGASVLLPKGPKLLALLEQAMSPPDPAARSTHAALVEIYNTTDHPGWDSLAAERLHYAGFETRPASPALDDLRLMGDGSQTLLFDFTPTQGADQASNLLAILGLPTSRLRSSPTPNSTASYRLVLGMDYDPCFDPARFTQ